MVIVSCIEQLMFLDLDRYDIVIDVNDASYSAEGTSGCIDEN